MNRFNRRTFGRVVVLSTMFLALTSVGCTTGALWHLLGGANEKSQPSDPLPPKPGMDQVRVAIIVHESPTISPNFIGVSRELATLIGRRMTEETADEDHPIIVVDQATVRKAVGNGGKDFHDPRQIGLEVGADYVIDLTLNSISMFQPEDAGQFFKGSGNITGIVYDVDDPDTTFRDYVHQFSGIQRGVGTVNEDFYRRYLIDKAATEIAHRHVPHVARTELPQLQ